MESQPQQPRRVLWTWEIIAWIGTAVMLVTYAMMSGRYLSPGKTFFACQLVGQIALAVVSASKRAWQPAFANLAFGFASVVGLIHSFIVPG
jgi:hypothetical protein